MPATDIEFVNAALTRSGLERISSFDDANTRAQVAKANYEITVQSELSHRWHWATKTEILAKLSDPAPDPWLYAYQLPTDADALRTVMQSGKPINYLQMGSKVMTLADNDGAEVVAHFGWRPLESDWPAWFAEPLIRRLEAIFLRSLKEQPAEAVKRDESADKGFAQARRIDSQNQSPRDPYTYPILAARRA
jgi:hypothetical protein